MDSKKCVTLPSSSTNAQIAALQSQVPMSRPPRTRINLHRNYQCLHSNMPELTELQDDTLVRLGDKFESPESLREHLYANSKRWGVYYICYDSKYLEKYTMLKYKCSMSPLKDSLSHGTMYRKKPSKKTNCPSFITLSTAHNFKTLVVTQVCHHHDHPISDEEFAKLSHAKFLPPYLKNEFMDLIAIGVQPFQIQRYFESITHRTIATKIITNYRLGLQHKNMLQRKFSEERLNFLNIKKALIEKTYGDETKPKQKIPNPANVPRKRKYKRTTTNSQNVKIKKAVPVAQPMYVINKECTNRQIPSETNQSLHKRSPRWTKTKNTKDNSYSERQITEVGEMKSAIVPLPVKKNEYNEVANGNNTMPIQAYDESANETEFEKKEIDMLQFQNNDDHYEDIQESISEVPEKFQCYELFQTNTSYTNILDSFLNDHSYISAHRHKDELAPICTLSAPILAATLRSEQTPLEFTQRLNVTQGEEKACKRKVNEKEDKQHKRYTPTNSKMKKENRSHNNAKSRLVTRLETLSRDEETLQCVQNLRESAALTEWNPWYAEYYPKTVNGSNPILLNTEPHNASLKATEDTVAKNNMDAKNITIQEKESEIIHVINLDDDTNIDQNENNADKIGNDLIEQFYTFSNDTIREMVEDSCITDYNISLLKTEIQEVLNSADKEIQNRKRRIEFNKESQNKAYKLIDKYNIAEHILDPEISTYLDVYAKEKGVSLLSILQAIYRGNIGLEISRGHFVDRRFVESDKGDAGDLNLIVKLKECLEKAVKEVVNLNEKSQKNEVHISKREILKNNISKNIIDNLYMERKEFESKLLQLNTMFEQELVLEANIIHDKENKNNELVSNSKLWLAVSTMKLQIEGLENEIKNLTNIKTGLLSDIILERKEIDKVNTMKNNIIDIKNTIIKKLDYVIDNNSKRLVNQNRRIKLNEIHKCSNTKNNCVLEKNAALCSESDAKLHNIDGHS